MRHTFEGFSLQAPRLTFLTFLVDSWSFATNVDRKQIKLTVLLPCHYSMLSIQFNSIQTVLRSVCVCVHWIKAEMHSQIASVILLSHKHTRINYTLLALCLLPKKIKSPSKALSMQHCFSCRWCDKIQNKLSAELPQVTAALRDTSICVSVLISEWLLRTSV